MFTALLNTAYFFSMVVMKSKKQITEEVGNSIREARENTGISQEQLSADAGLYRTYVGHIEVGLYTPSIYTLYKLAKALKLQVKDLIKF